LQFIGGSSFGGVVLQRVLVVEDEEPVGRALERWLKRQRVHVLLLIDTARLEETIAAFQPTHVVSDLRMAPRDGVEVLSVVKRLAPHAVRSLLSGSLETLTEASLATISPCNLISKPWQESTLAADLGLVRGVRS